MDEAGSRAGIPRLSNQVFAIRLRRFGLVLRLQAPRQPLQGLWRVRPNFQRMTESHLGFRWLASPQVQFSEVVIGREVVSIEMQDTLERSRGPFLISRPVLRNGQDRSRPALRGKQLHP